MKQSLQFTALIAAAFSTSVIAYALPKLLSYYRRRRFGRIAELTALIKRASNDFEQNVDFRDLPDEQLITLEAALKDLLHKFERTHCSSLLSSETEKYFTPPNDSDKTEDSVELHVYDGYSWKYLRDGYHKQEHLDDLKLLVEENRCRQFYVECANYYSKNTITFRKNRMSFFELTSIVDFMIKLHAVRSAFAVICEDQENVTQMLYSIKEIIILVFKVSGRPSSSFEAKFDNMVAFCQDESNREKIFAELKQRKIADFSFYDIFLDFMIIDSLSDLENIPQTMISVLQNRWLPKQLKENAFCNLVWSYIQAKMKFLQDNTGFIGKFYLICESVNPVFAWGLLGDQGNLNEACVFIKESFIKYMKKIFNQNKVSYDTSNELASDILRGAKKILNRIRLKLNSFL